MTIVSIESWRGDADRGIVRVKAIVDGTRCVRPVSRWEPEEWAPALCSTSVLVEPGDWPGTEKEQKQWLESYGPEWSLEDTSDYF